MTIQEWFALRTQTDHQYAYGKDIITISMNCPKDGENTFYSSYIHSTGSVQYGFISEIEALESARLIIDTLAIPI